MMLDRRKQMKTTVNRYYTDATATVYRGSHYCSMVFCPIRGGRSDYAAVYRGSHFCGMVFCPIQGCRSDYLARAWTDAVPQQTFGTEAEAIDYLVREG
jgi:hypothetical protein